MFEEGEIMHVEKCAYRCMSSNDVVEFNTNIGDTTITVPTLIKK